MESLESFDCGKTTPVDCLDVPDGKGTKDTGESVAKQSNRDYSQDNGSRTQRQIVKEVLRRKHSNGLGGIGGGRGCDGAYGVFFQVPWPIIKKRDDRDPSWKFALAALFPPSGLVSIATREKGGPCLAQKVGDEDEKSPLDGDSSGFELDKGLACVRQ